MGCLKTAVGLNKALTEETACFQILSKDKVSTTVDLIKVLRGFKEVCDETYLEVKIEISDKYYSYVKISSKPEALSKCSSLLKALLKSEFGTKVDLIEVDCMTKNPLDLNNVLRR